MKMMDFVKHWRQWRIYSLPVLIMFSLVVVSMRRPEQGHSIPLENFIPVENADPKREIFQEMKVSQCGCSKLVPTNEIPPNPIWDQGNTTCSLDTWIRGPHQGVIGFTYFEHPAKTDKAKSRDYLQGVQDNLELMKEYYPGFVMRLYHNLSPESNTLKSFCDLACREPMMDLCNISQNPRLGNATVLYALLWRFLPVIDAQVDTFFSRDLDSRINAREAAAVEEFLDSPKTFHVMRDHPAHTAYIMGGMWGAKVSKIRRHLLLSFRSLFKNQLAYMPSQEGGYDQIALQRYVWRWAKKDMVAHDSFGCHKFASTRAFPTQRDIHAVGNFVGSVVSVNSSLGEGPGAICPEKCRPVLHKDWIYC